MSFSVKMKNGEKLTFNSTSVNLSNTYVIDINVNDITSLGNELINSDMITPRNLLTGNESINLLGYTPKWLNATDLGTDTSYRNYIVYKQITENYYLAVSQAYGDNNVFWWRVFLVKNLGQTGSEVLLGFQSGSIQQLDSNNRIPVNSYLITDSLTIPLVSLTINDNDTYGNITDIGVSVSHLATGPYGATITGNLLNTSTILYSTSDLTREFIAELNTLPLWEEGEPITPPINNQGTFDNSSDIITLPNLESLNISSALSSEFIRAYYLEKSEVNAFSDFLWSESFTNSILKNQNSPIDNIQKCYLLPFDIVTRDAKSQLKVGNIVFNNSNAEQILAYRIDNQFQEVDFGNIEIKEYYGNFLDYKTNIEIFLPFIGTNKLNIYEVMNSTINLTYRIDILTGNCIALIRVIKDSFGTELNSLLYTFTGNCANELPLNQQINQSMVNRFNTLTDIFLNPLGAITKIPQIAKDLAYSENFGDIMAIKHSSSLNGNNGFMGCYNPYLIITRPINANPKDYVKYNGLPTYYTSKLSDVTGYVEIDNIISTQPDNIPLPLWDDIISKLKDGVIIN